MSDQEYLLRLIGFIAHEMPGDLGKIDTVLNYINTPQGKRYPDLVDIRRAQASMRLIHIKLRYVMALARRPPGEQKVGYLLTAHQLGADRGETRL